MNLFQQWLDFNSPIAVGFLIAAVFILVFSNSARDVLRKTFIKH